MSVLVRCDYCERPAVLADSAVVYGRSYGMIWICYPCDAYVGVHKNSKRHIPLGRLANRELRGWKKKAHAAFDPLWRTGGMTRGGAYEYLQQALGIPAKEAHIGMFDVDRCKKLVAALQIHE